MYNSKLLDTSVKKIYTCITETLLNMQEVMLNYFSNKNFLKNQRFGLSFNEGSWIVNPFCIGLS